MDAASYYARRSATNPRGGSTLADEIRRGRVLLIGDRYVLNGGLADDVKRALLDLALVDDRR